MPWYSTQEIINQPFVYPKNLKNMTEAEKDRLRQNYLEHQGSMADDEIQLNPTVLFEAAGREMQEEIDQEFIENLEDPEVRARILPQFIFDPVLGYVVPGEDPQAIAHVDMSEADRTRILQRPPRPVSAQQIEIHRIASMGAVEREIEERFGDI